MNIARPFPPLDLVGADGLATEAPFRAAPELAGWARQTFISPGGPLANPDHEHLAEATLGCLWCALPRASKGNMVVGQAERRALQGNTWARARQEQQFTEWFGVVPDFILTFHADYAASADDASFCALVEHELYHCGQEKDAYGAPKFRLDGSPAFTIRGHDVEEFVGVVRRYGIEATTVGEMVRAANKGPEIAAASVAHACGTCLRRVA